SLALQIRAECQHPAIGVPAPDDLKTDGETVGREAARQRHRRMAGKIERPEIWVPRSTDGPGLLPVDDDGLERVVVDREGLTRERRGDQDVEAFEEGLYATVYRGSLRQRVGPINGRPPSAVLDRLAQASRDHAAPLGHVGADARGQPTLQEHEEHLFEGREVFIDRLDA